MAEGEKADAFHGPIRNQVRFETGLFTPFWSCGSLLPGPQLLTGALQKMRVKVDGGLTAAFADGG
jgi:hypothetical protein